MKIGIIGAGTMGVGVAQVCSQNGYEVILYARRSISIEKGLSSITKNLDRLIKKEKIQEADKEKTLNRIATTSNLEDLKDADLVIEAIAENMQIKKDLFKKLDEICKEGTILATNTSSLSITDIASSTNRPDKVIGMHFFNPVPMMKLVEVIKGILTSKETCELIFEVAKNIQKEPVHVKEAPGFVVNRLLIPMINEAIFIYAEGIASIEDIDQAMKLGANHPMGPLALSDLIGNDVVLAIMDTLYEEFEDSKYRAHPLLRKIVRANLLGRKTERGFYTYNK